MHGGRSMSPEEKRYAIWGLGLAGASVVFAALSYFGGFFDRNPPVAEEVFTTEFPQTTTAVAEPTTLAEPSSAFEQLIRTRTIGAQVAFWESVAGTAISVNGGWREYEVDGCEVRTFAENSEIQTVHVALTPACTFDWQKVIYNARGLPLAHQTTFAQFVDQQGAGDYFADCLSSCGNAALNYVLMKWQGSHADDWIEVNLGASVNSDAVVDADQRISQHYERTLGRDGLIDALYNCATDKAEVFGPALAPLRVQWVEFGRGLSETNSYLPPTSCT
jgi:hypothetical protein